MRLLLSHELGVYSAHIKLSTVAHPHAKMGCFAKQGSPEGYVDGLYNGTMVYQFMMHTPNARGVCGEGVMVDTCDKFCTFAIMFAKEIFCLDKVLQTVWLV